MKTTFKVTEIQFYDGSSDPVYEGFNRYEASIVINNRFLIQVEGDKDVCNESIPHSDEACWNNKRLQDEAFFNLEIEDVVREIEEDGFENNFYYLSENADISFK